MKHTHTLWRFCAASAALCAATLAVAVAVAPAAGAAGNKPDFVRVSKDKGTKGSGLALGTRFRDGQSRSRSRSEASSKRFDNRGDRPSFVKRRDEDGRRRPPIGAVGYYSVRDYDYGYRPDPEASAPGYRPQANEAAPTYQPRPVTPKWIHVGEEGASSLNEGPFAGDGAGRNCLSVKTRITVEGEPVDAFGEACLLADGSWELRPSGQAD